MHIVLLGGGGAIAQRIAREALGRGHQVTAVVRDPATFEKYDDRLQVVQGDATDPASVARVARGADVIVNAISPRPGKHGRPASSLTAAARALIAGAKRAGVERLIIVGGAGSLEVAPGRLHMDEPTFNPLYRPEAEAGAEALQVYRSEAGGLDWTYVSPASEIGPGERTGRYRLGGDQLLVDAAGHSRISYDDYAAALIDELERDAHPRRRITVAY